MRRPEQPVPSQHKQAKKEQTPVSEGRERDVPRRKSVAPSGAAPPGKVLTRGLLRQDMDTDRRPGTSIPGRLSVSHVLQGTRRFLLRRLDPALHLVRRRVFEAQFVLLVETAQVVEQLARGQAAQRSRRHVPHLLMNGVRIRTLGELSAFKPGLRSLMEDAVERTKHNTGLCFNIAVNYGSRDEIVHAVRRIAAEGIAPDAVTEQTIADRLYTSGLPELDLIIRTAGEERLSNFLLWQAAYAEFVFSKTLWPDFTPEVYFGCLREFLNRTRRFGRVL